MSEGKISPRRSIALLTQNGNSILVRQNPYIVLWWSASFPGFGHFLLNHYFRGFLLVVSEILINTLANVNKAMMYSFCGQFELAVQALDPTWVYGYLFIYYFSIWDSHRLAFESNKQLQLASMENAPIKPYMIGKYCIQFLDLKSPATAAVCSALFPGLGQLYIARLDLALFNMVWWWIFVWKSRLYDAVLALLSGDAAASTSVLNPHWMLFMPSVFSGSVYHAHFIANEHNKLFRLEQRQFMQERYRTVRVDKLLELEE